MNKKGFTLIELLVVIAIIGMLSTMAIVAMNNARSKSRDARRISDIKQIQTALEMWYNDNNGYPVRTTAGQLSSITGFLATVPTPPTPGDSTVAGCSATSPYYTYQAPDATTYTLQYCLGGVTGGIPAGLRRATPSAIQ